MLQFSYLSLGIAMIQFHIICEINYSLEINSSSDVQNIIQYKSAIYTTNKLFI
jgi:hypothetical protein